ncbi:MAG: tripartite tricarboxylate transporter TctB family protein [Alphaproteobacteria bacterium]|nr:tripartite tricarboxylate transporter TctB family protein [Alphaproteobacteria bacterium]
MDSPQSAPKYLRYEDLICGVALVALAAFALWVSRAYPLGTTANMGPGYFPRAMCVIIGALGLVLVVTNLLKPLYVPSSPDRLKLRPLVTVASSFVAFALSLNTIGLLPAILLLIVISSFAITKRSVWEILAIAVALETLAFLMWYLVRMPAPLFGKN